MVKVLAYNKKKVYASCHGNVSTVRKTQMSTSQGGGSRAWARSFSSNEAKKSDEGAGVPLKASEWQSVNGAAPAPSLVAGPMDQDIRTSAV